MESNLARGKTLMEDLNARALMFIQVNFFNFQKMFIGCEKQGFPLKFYFRGHKTPMTFILEGIWGDFGGQLYNI